MATIKSETQDKNRYTMKRLRWIEGTFLPAHLYRSDILFIKLSKQSILSNVRFQCIYCVVVIFTILRLFGGRISTAVCCDHKIRQWNDNITRFFGLYSSNKTCYNDEKLCIVNIYYARLRKKGRKRYAIIIVVVGRPHDATIKVASNGFFMIQVYTSYCTQLQNAHAAQ